MLSMLEGSVVPLPEVASGMGAGSARVKGLPSSHYCL